jgi:hypothetical protein
VWLAVLSLALAAPVAEAAVKKISQGKANHGHVSPGDAPGYPITISRSGSYQLITDLTLPTAEGTVGIEITAENVTLDLNGFSVIGPRTCPTENDFLACTPAAEDPTYALVTAGRNVTIKNGTLRGSIGAGVWIGAHGRLENVNVIWNSMIAIIAGKGTVLKDSLVAQNYQPALMLSDECLVTGNRFRVHTDPVQLGPACAWAGNVFDCASGFSCVTGGAQAGINICDGVPCTTTP